MTREEMILHAWEARFAPPDPTVYRTTASTPLAPPPVDEPKPNLKASVKTEAPTKKPRAGFVINGFDQRKLERERRKREPIPAQIPQADCPHGKDGFSRDGRSLSGGRDTGRLRLKCRTCGYRLHVWPAEAEKILDGAEWRKVITA